MARLDKDKIRESLTTEDIHKILYDLGSAEAKQDNKGNPIYSTICHHSDSDNHIQKNKHKLYYYAENHNFYCFSGCGNISDIYELVIKVKEQQGFTFTFVEALKHVAELTNKHYSLSRDGDKKNSDKVDDWSYLNRFKKRKKMTSELPSFDESVLDVFLPYPHESWVNEGINHDVMQQSEIGYYFKSEAITIPHRDENGRLVGIRQRNLLQEDVDAGRKYIPTVCNGTMYNHLTMYNLYNLHISKENIRRHKRVYIFEGEKSCLLSRTFYKEDDFSVAVSGSNVSDYQVEKLLSLGVEHVILAFDKFRAQKDKESDEKYEKFLLEYQKKLVRIGHKFAPYVRFFILWDSEGKLEHKDSPIDKGQEVFEYLTDHKTEITTQEGMID